MKLAKAGLVTESVARSSLHVSGKACDFRIPGVSAEYTGKLCRYLQGGGVGVYQDKGFVHVDTGRVRQWRG
jgi:uncharacterized protein YcbK (DUF882 family)